MFEWRRQEAAKPTTLDADAIRERLAVHEVRRLETAEFRSAAVLMPIRFDRGEPEVLFTKRTETLRTHKGHISYPGGRPEPEDDGLLQTALRETREEVGIDPEHVEVLGELDEVVTLTKFHIQPYVGAIHDPPELTICADEVDTAFWAPLPALADTSIVTVSYQRFLGSVYPIYYFDYAGYNIWGATAKMLINFMEIVLGLRVVHEDAPPGLLSDF